MYPGRPVACEAPRAPAAPPVVIRSSDGTATSLSTSRDRARNLIQDLQRFTFDNPGVAGRIRNHALRRNFPVLSSRLEGPNTQTAVLDLGDGARLTVERQGYSYTRVDLTTADNVTRSLLTGVPVEADRTSWFRGASSGEPPTIFLERNPQSLLDVLALLHEQGHAAEQLSQADDGMITRVYDTHASSPADIDAAAVVLGHERRAWAFGLRKARANGLLRGVPVKDVRSLVKLCVGSYFNPWAAFERPSRGLVALPPGASSRPAARGPTGVRPAPRVSVRTRTSVPSSGSGWRSAGGEMAFGFLLDQAVSYWKATSESPTAALLREADAEIAEMCDYQRAVLRNPDSSFWERVRASIDLSSVVNPLP